MREPISVSKNRQFMVVIEEDDDEIEVTYVDLTAAYIIANA